MERKVTETVSYEVETTGGLQMEVSIAKVTHTDHNGRHPLPDEVCFFISGYDSLNDDLATHVTISKDEAKELAGVLLALASK